MPLLSIYKNTNHRDNYQKYYQPLLINYKDWSCYYNLTRIA